MGTFVVLLESGRHPSNSTTNPALFTSMHEILPSIAACAAATNATGKMGNARLELPVP